MSSILPNDTAPTKNFKYMDPDALRQLLRQERIRWHLKVNKNVDYYDTARDSRYTGEIVNEGYIQKMETRVFPNNDTYGGYVGLISDIGNSDNKGFSHDLEKWDHGATETSKNTKVHRLTVGVTATIPGKYGYGLNDQGNMTASTTNRMSMVLFDPYDGRAYLFTNDEPYYINNAMATVKRPGRTIARLADIPTSITQLSNDLNFVSDPGYIHTDNNLTNSNKFIVDNIDDRTFVYPEIAQDSNGEYIDNIFVNPDGTVKYRRNDNEDYPAGYMPGVFTSIDKLNRVDLVHQRKPLHNQLYPDGRRDSNYYIHDGRWNPMWNNTFPWPPYASLALNPKDMETELSGFQPTPYFALDPGIRETIIKDGAQITVNKLHQWRYNRVDITYPSSDITINVVSGGSGYVVGDELQWSFGNDLYKYRVDSVIADGSISSGQYVDEHKEFNDDPSTGDIVIEFTNTTGTGSGATFKISASPKISVISTQLKNNLYAYVNVGTNTSSMDTTSPWIDNGMDGIKSGINKGRGCLSPLDTTETYPDQLAEHTGATGAGLQVHLFRYVINTTNPTFKFDGEYPVFTGKWVDEGPLGVERPQDIKSLLFANPDTNNFNNYYKFSMDLLMDTINRNPDSVATANSNTLTVPLFHVDTKDPTSSTVFTTQVVDPTTNEIKNVDVTRRVIYVNAATGVWFIYNTTVKNDEHYGHPQTPIGWIPIAGVVSR